jgi:transposase-like protein
MSHSNVINLKNPEQSDPLQDVLREGARKMLAAAIEAEVSAFIEQHRSLKTHDGKAAVVRNGYLPERTIQTGLGDIDVKVPKVRDRSGSGLKFNSSLVPPYLKRTKNIEEFLPWLYLRGISTGDFSSITQAPARP